MESSLFSEFIISLDQSEQFLSKIQKWKHCLLEKKVEVRDAIFVFTKVNGFSSEVLSRFLRSVDFQEFRKNFQTDCSIILVADGQLSNKWQLLDLGLSDVIFFKDQEEFVKYCQDLNSRATQIRNILESGLVKNNIIGASPVWLGFLREVVTAAVSGKGNVFLYGETGTGKELLARLIHTVDRKRSKNNLVVLDCTTIVPDLSGSELFGHERGSFTNASYPREGAFALADGGTLFMDEIGDLPLRLQAEFLRVLQEKKYKKVGANQYKPSDFRLISATNKDLTRMVDEGFFRSDLYYRISDHTFKVPSLRERREDIPLLARHFLAIALETSLEETPDFDKEVLSFLIKRDYPGNIRELQQLVNRIAKNHYSHCLVTPGEIPLPERNRTSEPKKFGQEEGLYQILKSNLMSGLSLNEIKKQTMQEAIKAALDIHSQDKQRAAMSLGITVRAIQKFFQKNK